MAFTGAVTAKQGLFEEAEGGTLLLDAIGDMPMPLQAKMLRALQDGEVRRVGESRAFTVDVRIICATHRDLAERVERGAFRQDLYYRLKVFTLTVPPLRERIADILPLARLFLENHGRADAVVQPAARKALEAHGWPGNVRELANAVEHAVALSQGGDIALQHLPEDVIAPARRRGPAPTMRTLAEVEREHVLRVVEACGGRQVEAARVLGIGRNTLWRKLRDYGIDVNE